MDHNRAKLGSGEATFRRAIAALHDWRMSSLGWTSIHREATIVEPGQVVAVVVHHFESKQAMVAAATWAPS